MRQFLQRQQPAPQCLLRPDDQVNLYLIKHSHPSFTSSKLQLQLTPIIILIDGASVLITERLF